MGERLPPLIRALADLPFEMTQNYIEKKVFCSLLVCWWWTPVQLEGRSANGLESGKERRRIGRRADGWSTNCGDVQWGSIFLSVTCCIVEADHSPPLPIPFHCPAPQQIHNMTRKKATDFVHNDGCTIFSLGGRFCCHTEPPEAIDGKESG